MGLGKLHTELYKALKDNKIEMDILSVPSQCTSINRALDTDILIIELTDDETRIPTSDAIGYALNRLGFLCKDRGFKIFLDRIVQTKNWDYNNKTTSFNDTVVKLIEDTLRSHIDGRWGYMVILKSNNSVSKKGVPMSEIQKQMSNTEKAIKEMNKMNEIYNINDKVICDTSIYKDIVKGDKLTISKMGTPNLIGFKGIEGMFPIENFSPFNKFDIIEPGSFLVEKSSNLITQVDAISEDFKVVKVKEGLQVLNDFRLLKIGETVILDENAVYGGGLNDAKGKTVVVKYLSPLVVCYNAVEYAISIDRLKRVVAKETSLGKVRLKDKIREDNGLRKLTEMFPEDNLILGGSTALYLQGHTDIEPNDFDFILYDPNQWDTRVINALRETTPKALNFNYPYESDHFVVKLELSNTKIDLLVYPNKKTPSDLTESIFIYNRQIKIQSLGNIIEAKLNSCREKDIKQLNYLIEYRKQLKSIEKNKDK